ncbi:MAG: YihY/virulence factor BrkB family protein, partial [Candidatus Acidiferrum sp.]
AIHMGKKYARKGWTGRAIFARLPLKWTQICSRSRGSGTNVRAGNSVKFLGQELERHMADRDLGDRWSTAIAALVMRAIARFSRAHQRIDQPDYGLNRSSARRDNSRDKRVRTAEGGSIDSPARRRNFILVIIERVSRDNLTLVAAGVAFYALLALFPALGVMVSLYGLIADPGQIAHQIEGFGNLLPPEALKLLTGALRSIVQTGSSKHDIALITSLLVSLWSAKAALSSIMTGLTIAYQETEERSFVMQYVIALGLTLGGIVFAIAALLALAGIPALLSLMPMDDRLRTLLALGRWPVLAILVLFSSAVLYRFAPYRTEPKWRWITWGSAFAALAWLAASALFSFYVTNFSSYDTTYGSLGAVVILLLWFWVGTLVLLAGAEIDAELEVRDKASLAPAMSLR